MNHLIWIIPLLMLAVIAVASRRNRPAHGAHQAQPAAGGHGNHGGGHGGGQHGWVHWIWITALVILIAVCSVEIHGCFKKRIAWDTAMADARAKRAEYERTHSVLTPSTPAVKQHIPSHQLYRFDETGCATVTVLPGSVSWYPKGGEVTIYPPAPAESWDDAPGIMTAEEGVPHTPGNYRICRKEGSTSWGIEVWN